MNRYPEGGGTVGTANSVYGGGGYAPQEQSGGMDLSGLAANLMKKKALAEASGTSAGGGKKGASTVGAAPSGAAAPVAGGGTTASSVGPMMAAASPWAAIMAAMAANETYQNKSGNRPNDFSEQMFDMVTGKGLERDAERYLGGNAAKVLRTGTPSGLVRNTKDLVKKLRGWF
jgi:hypothetical protein